MSVFSRLKTMFWGRGSCLVKPVGSDEAAGARAFDRARRIVLSLVASYGARGIGILTGLVTVPLTLKYLGAERYGIWMTLSSFFMLLSFADLGLGGGLLNHISEANGKDDRLQAAKAVSSAFFILSAIGLVIGLVSTLVIPWLGVGSLFKMSAATAGAELRAATLCVGLILAVNVPLGIVDRVRAGYQEGYVTSVFQIGGNLAAFVCLLTVIHFGGSLAWLVLALTAPPALAVMANGARLFATDKPYVRPRWKMFDRTVAISILRVGVMFLALQVAMSLAYASDNLVILRCAGPEAVTGYSVPMRLFSTITMLANLATAPLWPAFGEAIARGDFEWVRRTLKFCLVTTALLTGGASLILVVLGKWLVHLWVGSKVEVDYPLLASMGVLTVVLSCGGVVAMWLNAASALRFQVVVATVFGVAALGLKILFVKWYGLPGIAWGTCLAYLIFAGTPYILFVPKLMRDLARK